MGLSIRAYGLTQSLEFTGKTLLRNHTQLGNTRRDIARAKTVIAQKQREAKGAAK